MIANDRRSTRAWSGSAISNYHLSASGFLAEIDRMQLEAREYLSLHSGELKASA